MKQEIKHFSKLLSVPKKPPTDNSNGGLVLEEINLILFSFCFCRGVSSARSQVPQ